MLITPRTRPARNSATKANRSVMRRSHLAEIPAEPRQRRGPRAACCLEVRAGLRVLRPQEAVSRTGENLRLVRLSSRAHRRVGGRDRRVDALIVFTVQSEHGRAHRRQLFGWRRGTIVCDGGAERGCVGGVIKDDRSAPAESHDAIPRKRGRKPHCPTSYRVDAGLNLLRIESASERTSRVDWEAIAMKGTGMSS